MEGTPMSELVVLTISHRLGKEEAARRLKKGFADLPSHFTPLFRMIDQRWSEDRFEFSLSAFMQLVSGTIDVADDYVRIELMLPRLLAKLASQIPGVIQRETHLMLEKK
jgi:Putative polyhydroxyalkanoic acid system protein (PHA_gran_rgn)